MLTHSDLSVFKHQASPLRYHQSCLANEAHSVTARGWRPVGDSGPDITGIWVNEAG